MKRNNVLLRPDCLIEIQVVGDQDIDSVQQMGDKTKALAEQLTKDAIPVRVLDVLFEMGTVPPEARKRVVQLAKTLEYDRLAMVGKHGVLLLGTNLLLRATGRGEKVKFFTDYNAAIEWLNH